MTDSKPLAALGSGPDDAWDDDDEKTTVFDRSHEESAQALLQKAPTPAAGMPPRPSAPPRSSAPPPPPPSIPAPRPSGPASAQQHVAAPVGSTHVASARPMAPTTNPSASYADLAGGLSAAPPKKNFLLIAGAAIAAVLGGFFLFGGDGTGGMVVSVAGPGGTAVEGVSVFLDDKEICKTSTCKVADLAPGTYVVRAKADGYADMAGTAYSVEAGEEKAINIELINGLGGTGLKVQSEAPGLTLSIDGKKIGALPQELTDIEPGQHKLTLSGSLFVDEFTETITVKKGEMLEFEPDLKLSKGQVNIKLNSSARGAKIALLVDGKRRSLTSRFGSNGEKSVKIDLPLEGKTYKVEARKKGYEPFEEELKFTLKEPVQTIAISLEEGSDEEEESSSSSRTTRTSSSSSSSGSRPATSASSSSSASSGKGTLNINSIPKSNVLLDGRPIGSTPRIGYTVSAGTHTVVFVHPEHGRKVKRVTVTKGGVGTAAVRFP